jgi:arylformamidase
MQDNGHSDMTRRTIIGAAAAATAGLAATGATRAAAPDYHGCRVGPPPHPKGPLVFMDYDQIELDAAYDQTAYAPMRDQITARRFSNSAEVRRRLGNPMRESYGPSEIEKLDIFRTSKPNAPIFVFTHGGAWLSGSASEYHFAAEMFTNMGVNYVALDFVNVGEANGDIRVMAAQVQRGLAWVYKNAARFGGDANRLYIGGQSSGAHLSGVALVQDWTKQGLPPDFIKGAVLLSGMYEMKPVRLSSRGKYVKFDDAMEESMSTIRHIQNLRAPVTVVYGTYETPEFQRQSRDFAAAVKAAGKEATLIEVPNHNHFELQETLANPYGWAGRAALARMGLGKA